VTDKRQLIVCDIESTGLDLARHVPLEVAAINVDTDEHIWFVPYLNPHDLLKADPEALEINRYYERGVWRNALTQEDTYAQYLRLWDMLRGNTLGGANPRFDADMLLAAPDSPTVEVWHYALADVKSYVAGALGLYPAELPSLFECCGLLGVENGCEHSALEDARAAVECFHQAARLRGGYANRGTEVLQERPTRPVSLHAAAVGGAAPR
jgi:DNA polymerase-3 subunit epsilon